MLLILDLDGVLITTPIWKADEMDFDAYSKFNESCVVNLNKLLSQYPFKICLSSKRRTQKSIEDFNQIFKNRNINQEISQFLPECLICKTKKDEIYSFIKDLETREYFIIDDDKSLHDFDSEILERTIITNPIQGFNNEQLEFAYQKLENAM